MQERTILLALIYSARQAKLIVQGVPVLMVQMRRK